MKSQSTSKSQRSSRHRFYKNKQQSFDENQDYPEFISRDKAKKLSSRTKEILLPRNYSSDTLPETDKYMSRSYTGSSHRDTFSHSHRFTDREMRRQDDYKYARSNRVERMYYSQDRRRSPSRERTHSRDERDKHQPSHRNITILKRPRDLHQEVHEQACKRQSPFQPLLTTDDQDKSCEAIKITSTSASTATASTAAISIPSNESNVETSKNLKHIMCNSLTRKVVCPHGEKCWYAHSVEERKKHLIQKPCIYLRADGTCSIPNCRFDHDIKPDDSTKVQVERINKPCKFIQPDGTCKFGAACKFSHDIREEQPESFVICFDSSDEENDEASEAESDSCDIVNQQPFNGAEEDDLEICNITSQSDSSVNLQFDTVEPSSTFEMSYPLSAANTLVETVDNVATMYRTYNLEILLAPGVGIQFILEKLQSMLGDDYVRSFAMTAQYNPSQVTITYETPAADTSSCVTADAKPSSVLLDSANESEHPSLAALSIYNDSPEHSTI